MFTPRPAINNRSARAPSLPDATVITLFPPSSQMLCLLLSPSLSRYTQGHGELRMCHPYVNVEGHIRCMSECSHSLLLSNGTSLQEKACICSFRPTFHLFERFRDESSRRGGVLGPCRTERAPPLSDHSCLRDAARPAAPRDPPIKGTRPGQPLPATHQ